MHSVMAFYSKHLNIAQIFRSNITLYLGARTEENFTLSKTYYFLRIFFRSDSSGVHVIS